MKHPKKSWYEPRCTALLLSTAGMLALLSGCAPATGESAAPSPAPGTPVTASLVVEREVVETQEFSGRLEAIDRVEIRSRVSGYITDINFKPGALVKKGDVLFVIDPRPYQADVDRAQAAAAAARAKAELARIEVNRAELLLKDRAIAQREFDEKASALRELDANVLAARAQVDAARLNLEYARVKAPIDGRVSKEEITVGNLVDASALLTSVVSTERIYATFEGDEATYLRVARQTQQGKAVTVKAGLASETGFPHEGKLEFVDNSLDTGTGSVRMRAVFANGEHALAPGLFARVRINTGSGAGDAANRRALLVADRAIGTDQSRKFVVVVGPGGKTEYREVKLGGLSDGLRIVTDGLQPGEKIVVSGLQRVRPGDVVMPTTVGMQIGAAKPRTITVAAAAAASNKE